MKHTALISALLAAFAIPTVAQATNGYFSHGYGIKAKGMGGTATAMSQDAFGGANNPASMVFAGDRMDLGAALFSPRRSASRTGSSMGGMDPGRDGSVDSDSNYFLVPEFGYNKLLNPDMSLGVTVYGNGGMNTDYSGGQIPANGCGPGAPVSNLLCGQGNLGVDLMQLVIAPTAAIKIAPNHSVGISPLIGYQRFKAEGVQAFGIGSGSSNLGSDDAFGYGVRIGYMGKLTPIVTIGAAYSSKINFSNFDKYKGLFAEEGDFDIPENYNLGIAVTVTPDLTLALDYQRINYSGVASVSNPSTNTFPLGSDNGPGFGWDDVNIWKLGAQYQYDKKWMFRAGYNHGDNPIQARDVTFNILAPGVIQDHVTLGVTYLTSTGGELTFSYMHGFETKVSGPSPTFGGSETIKMHQNAIGIAYGWKM
jgi:long-chain fatty acid transport protein